MADAPASADSSGPANKALALALRVARSGWFFRIWVVWGACFMLLWSLYEIYWISWLAQPIYLACVVGFLATTGRDLCSRCIHFDTWHCGGAGWIVARLFPSRDDAIGADDLLLHYVLMGVTLGGFLLGMFRGGMLTGLLAVAWLGFAALSAIPVRRPFSWMVGRSEAEAQVAALAENARKERARARTDGPQRPPRPAPPDGLAPRVGDRSQGSHGTAAASLQGVNLEGGIPLLEGDGGDAIAGDGALPEPPGEPGLDLGGLTDVAMPAMVGPEPDPAPEPDEIPLDSGIFELDMDKAAERRPAESKSATPPPSREPDTTGGPQATEAMRPGGGKLKR